MSDRTYRFTVVLTADATQEEMCKYIYDAVKGWGGSHHVDDPFFGDNKRVIEVKPVRTVKP
jgi:hypothetical protein